jgi:hypothetical protein
MVDFSAHSARAEGVIGSKTLEGGGVSNDWAQAGARNKKKDRAMSSFNQTPLSSSCLRRKEAIHLPNLLAV